MVSRALVKLQMNSAVITNGIVADAVRVVGQLESIKSQNQVVNRELLLVGDFLIQYLLQLSYPTLTVDFERVNFGLFFHVNAQFEVIFVIAFIVALVLLTLITRLHVVPIGFKLIVYCRNFFRMTLIRAFKSSNVCLILSIWL